MRFLNAEEKRQNIARVNAYFERRRGRQHIHHRHLVFGEAHKECI